MPVSGTVITAVASIAGILLLILAGVMGWVIKKLLTVEGDFQELMTSYAGSDLSEGHLEETRQNFERIHSRLDDFEDSISYYERQRAESHKEICNKIDSIVSVLEEEGMNGDLDNISSDD